MYNGGGSVMELLREKDRVREGGERGRGGGIKREGEGVYGEIN